MFEVIEGPSLQVCFAMVRSLMIHLKLSPPIISKLLGFVQCYSALHLNKLSAATICALKEVRKAG